MAYAVANWDHGRFLLRLALQFAARSHTTERAELERHVMQAASATSRSAQRSSARFTCNICGSPHEGDPSQIDRECLSCPQCKSTPRIRAVIYVLSMALFGRALALPEFPRRPELTGLGLSDWGYVHGLASKFTYRNTFYDEEPRLDITDAPRELHGSLDFLIASDVLEHVAPPVERAFQNSYQLLKPGGVFVVTVPYLLSGRNIEHYPTLNEYKIVDFAGRQILVNKTVEGCWEVFDNLWFHGGPGSILEMRIFSHPDLLRQLEAAGFEEIIDWKDRRPEFGAFWRQPHSFPVVARRLTADGH
jgi:SAM-dependent methyltransferase